MLSFSKF